MIKPYNLSRHEDVMALADDLQACAIRLGAQEDIPTIEEWRRQALDHRRLGVTIQ